MSDLAAFCRKRFKLYRKPGPEGFISFCRECVRVLGGDSETVTTTVPFRLWPAQEEFAGTLCRDRHIVSLKARQIGMTTEVLAFFLFRSLFFENQEFLIVSINEVEAKKSLDRIKVMIQHLPDWAKQDLEVSNTTTVKFSWTQSIIRVQASTRNAGRGTTPTGILVDEDATQVYADEIVLSALPALEKRKGWMIRLSTANGVGNSFHKCWVDAVGKKNGFTPVFINWTGDPSRTEGWYERELELRGKEYMQQEYPRTADEAFLSSGRPFFDMERVGRDLAGSVEPFTDGYVYGGKFVPQAGGVVRVWRKPEPGKKYVVGVDVSEGLEDGDWSVGYVKCVGESGECARLRAKCDPGELADVLWELGEWYAYRPVGAYAGVEGAVEEPALLAVEANNHGIACTLKLRERGYRRLYWQRDLETGRVLERVGWLTTSSTRRVMLGKFQEGYRKGEAVVRDRECLEEMAGFFHRGTAGKPQAGPGQHDDCVMARGITEIVAGMEAGVEVYDRSEEVLEVVGGAGVRYWAVKDQERIARGEEDDMNKGLEEMGG